MDSVKALEEKETNEAEEEEMESLSIKSDSPISYDSFGKGGETCIKVSCL
jgi:hypothetical protein